MIAKEGILQRWFWFLAAGVWLLAGPGLAEPGQQIQLGKPVKEQSQPGWVAADMGLPVELAAGMMMLSTANQTPYKSGEVAIPFGSQMTISEERLDADHSYVPFRWKSMTANVVSGQWQVVVMPLSYGTERWKYPAGIVAKGPAAAIPARGQPGYFVVDFGPILKLPTDYRLAPPGRPGTDPQFISLGTHSSTVHKRVFPAPRLRRDLFVDQVVTLAQHRAYYVRLVLLNASGAPVGVSSYATIRLAAPTPVDLFPDSVAGTTEKPANVASVKILRYEPPVYFNPSDREGRFIVLANCPPSVLEWNGWQVGQSVYLKPSEKDWWEQVRDAIGGTIEAIGDLIDWISHTWSDMQAEMVSGICGGNDTCESAAGPALKIGLAAIGIPPELPTSNDLCSMGKNYVAAYIASETPIPEELIRAGIDKMTDLVNNPPGGQGGAFLWPDPQFQNRQAFIEVEVSNTSAEPTTASLLWLLYGSSIGDTTTDPPSIPTWLDTKTPLPPLRPGQSLRFPIFLTRNPETMISHGADRLSTYLSRRVEIRKKGNEILFTGDTDWLGHKL